MKERFAEASGLNVDLFKYYVFLNKDAPKFSPDPLQK